MRVGYERSYAHISTEFCRERTLIGVIDGKPDTFLQSSCEHLVVFELLGTDTAAVQRVTAIEIASVCPVEKVVLDVELEIDRLRQVIDQQFDIRAVLWLLTRRNFKSSSEDAPLATIRRPLCVQ